MMLSRREFFLASVGLGAGALDAFDASCNYINSKNGPSVPEKAPERSPSFEEYFRTAETVIKHPIYRSASISIMSVDAQGARRSLGHGGLFVDENRTPYIMTQWHVVSFGNNGTFDLLMPGIGYWRVNNLGWGGMQNKRLDTDANVIYYPNIQTNIGQKIKSSIANGDVIPLNQYVPYGINSFRAVTVMADKGTIADLTFAGYNSDLNRLVFDVTQGRVCRGFSGQPVLVFENGIVTNKSCGLVAEASIETNRDCTSIKIYARPHI